MSVWAAARDSKQPLGTHLAASKKVISSCYETIGSSSNRLKIDVSNVNLRAVK